MKIVEPVPPPGVTMIPSDGSFPVWNLSFEATRDGLLSNPVLFAERIAAAPVSGIAFDLEGLGVPSPERTNVVITFVDELQVRGISVVLYGASADFLTAVAIDGADARIASSADLSRAVDTLRTYDAMRHHCTSERCRRVNQLRMPARALSLAPICAYASTGLRRAGVSDSVALGMLRECYANLAEILAAGYAPGDGDFAISVTVHDGRATITVLDGGRARAIDARTPASGRVDRVHRFRILDRHNAVVLEKELAVVAPG